ncbi:hypothetical protein NPIL_533841 [Nephila pilipes]|uniref:Uncharacterized protein n=1 Tax=Nephila pilipes TaxID=299642 RepID=A0A8X6PDC2_NEPPI|nr:hypothetical protein NPIL_533841 [Nephila pilipes]
MVWPELVFIVIIYSTIFHWESAKSAFDGEVKEIKLALPHLNARPPLSDQVVIFSDSQAVIPAIAYSSMSVLQCRSVYRHWHLEIEEKNSSLWSPSVRPMGCREKTSSILKTWQSFKTYKHGCLNISILFTVREATTERRSQWTFMYCTEERE